jgi:hypothetical protein
MVILAILLFINTIPTHLCITEIVWPFSAFTRKFWEISRLRRGPLIRCLHAWSHLAAWSCVNIMHRWFGIFNGCSSCAGFPFPSCPPLFATLVHRSSQQLVHRPSQQLWVWRMRLMMGRVRMLHGISFPKRAKPMGFSFLFCPSVYSFHFIQSDRFLYFVMSLLPHNPYFILMLTSHLSRIYSDVVLHLLCFESNCNASNVHIIT